MKLHALCASAVALTLAFIFPASAMDKVNRNFVIISTGSWVLVSACPGYEVIDGAPRKIADMNGANFDVLGPAMIAAWSAQIDAPYERSDLIPEVTQEVRVVINDIMDDMRKNKPLACAKWGKILLPVGILKRSR
jgi:hypothetical protein